MRGRAKVTRVRNARLKYSAPGGGRDLLTAGRKHRSITTTTNRKCRQGSSAQKKGQSFKSKPESERNHRSGKFSSDRKSRSHPEESGTRDADDDACDEDKSCSDTLRSTRPESPCNCHNLPTGDALFNSGPLVIEKLDDCTDIVWNDVSSDSDLSTGENNNIEDVTCSGDIEDVESDEDTRLEVLSDSTTATTEESSAENGKRPSLKFLEEDICVEQTTTEASGRHTVDTCDSRDVDGDDTPDSDSNSCLESITENLDEIVNKQGADLSQNAEITREKMVSSISSEQTAELQDDSQAGGSCTPVKKNDTEETNNGRIAGVDIETFKEETSSSDVANADCRTVDVQSVDTEGQSVENDESGKNEQHVESEVDQNANVQSHISTERHTDTEVQNWDSQADHEKAGTLDCEAESRKDPDQRPDLKRLEDISNDSRNAEITTSVESSPRNCSEDPSNVGDEAEVCGDAKGAAGISNLTCDLVGGPEDNRESEHLRRSPHVQENNTALETKPAQTTEQEQDARNDFEDEEDLLAKETISADILQELQDDVNRGTEGHSNEADTEVPSNEEWDFAGIAEENCHRPPGNLDASDKENEVVGANRPSTDVELDEQHAKNEIDQICNEETVIAGATVTEVQTEKSETSSCSRESLSLDENEDSLPRKKRSLKLDSPLKDVIPQIVSAPVFFDSNYNEITGNDSTSDVTETDSSEEHRNRKSVSDTRGSFFLSEVEQCEIIYAQGASGKVICAWTEVENKTNNNEAGKQTTNSSGASVLKSQNRDAVSRNSNYSQDQQKTFDYNATTEEVLQKGIFAADTSGVLSLVKPGRSATDVVTGEALMCATPTSPSDPAAAAPESEPVSTPANSTLEYCENSLSSISVKDAALLHPAEGLFGNNLHNLSSDSLEDLTLEEVLDIKFSDVVETSSVCGSEISADSLCDDHLNEDLAQTADCSEDLEHARDWPVSNSTETRLAEIFELTVEKKKSSMDVNQNTGQESSEINPDQTPDLLGSHDVRGQPGNLGHSQDSAERNSTAIAKAQGSRRKRREQLINLENKDPGIGGNSCSSDRSDLQPAEHTDLLNDTHSSGFTDDSIELDDRTKCQGEGAKTHPERDSERTINGAHSASVYSQSSVAKVAQQIPPETETEVRYSSRATSGDAVNPEIARSRDGSQFIPPEVMSFKRNRDEGREDLDSLSSDSLGEDDEADDAGEYERFEILTEYGEQSLCSGREAQLGCIAEEESGQGAARTAPRSVRSRRVRSRPEVFAVARSPSGYEEEATAL